MAAKKKKKEPSKATRSKKAIDKATDKAIKQPTMPVCHECEKTLAPEDQVYFVEEEVGRIFCSEACITDFFRSDIERIDQEYLARRHEDDYEDQEPEELMALRWPTLQDPEEVWVEKTLEGDRRYSFISKYDLDGAPVWAICICLMLRGEPSFLFTAFVSKHRALIDHFCKGEKLSLKEWRQLKKESAVGADDAERDETKFDRLATEWTDYETHQAQAEQMRKTGDIEEEAFAEYEECFEPTLQEPDELWRVASDPQVQTESDAPSVYHFLKRFEIGEKGITFIVIAKDANVEDELEVMDAFPTNDPDIVQHYRKGVLESSGGTVRAEPRKIVH